ncbi:MAG TPA: hypothetical protein VF663_04415 [Telluria sp.]|jgi:hypothetical protein
MPDLTIPEQIWQRACGSGPATPGTGDIALMAMLTFHGLVMNMGTLHAIKCLNEEQVAASRGGFRHFGFGNIAGVIGAGQHAVAQGLDEGELEETLEEAYAAIIDEDGVLMRAFEAHYAQDPSAYAPLVED